MGHRKRHSAAPSGAPRRTVSGARRIDERVRLGQALAAGLEPFGLGAAVVDPATLRFTFASEALASQLGTTVEELVALSSIVERVAPADARAAESALSHPRPSEVTLRFVHESGDEIELDLSIRPFDPDRQRADGSRSLAVIFRGVGERRERESLRTALGEAAEALRARDELFSIATHDVRSPLMALRLHAQVLMRCLKRESPDIPRARRALAEVEKHAERTMALADRLLDASRIRSGRLEIERVPMDLAEVVRDVATRFGPEAATAGSTIIIDGERSVLGWWDPLRMEQIVANLVSNALRFGGGNPISIELRTLGRRALLTIRDHGPGIADEDQARIFEPFERAQGAHGTPGFGLGLWIVRRLVDAHGGTVRLASAIGKGTVFAVDLPKDPQDEPSGPREDEVAPDRI